MASRKLNAKKGTKGAKRMRDLKPRAVAYDEAERVKGGITALELQMAMDRQSKTLQTLTNTLGKTQDTSGVVSNLK